MTEGNKGEMRNRFSFFCPSTCDLRLYSHLVIFGIGEC